jgi:hypothetical protein
MRTLLVGVALVSFFNFGKSPFEKYLQAHKIEIKPNQVYVLLSGYCCVNCTKASWATLNQIEHCPNLVVITGDEMVQQQLEGKATVLFDASYEFDYLPYNFSNTSLIRIQGDSLAIETFGIFGAHGFAETVAAFCKD